MSENKKTAVKKDLNAKEKELQKIIADLKKERDELIAKNDKLNLEFSEININYIKTLQSKNEEAKNKIDEIKQKSEAELKKAKKYAIKDQALELIEVINQFEMALSGNLTDDKLIRYQNGFKMFLTMFKNVLSELNVEEIIVNRGDKFDESIMEAYDITNESELDDDIVSEVIYKGYKLHDLVIKHVVVKVNKK